MWYDEFPENELLQSTTSFQTNIATGLSDDTYTDRPEGMKNEMFVARTVASTIRRQHLDVTSMMRIFVYDYATGKVKSTKMMRRATELSFDELWERIFSGENESSDTPPVDIGKVEIHFSHPDPRGGSGGSSKALGKGADTAILVYDHGNNLCAPESLAILAHRYDMLKVVAEQKSALPVQQVLREIISQASFDPIKKQIVTDWFVLERASEAKKPNSKTSLLRKQKAEDLLSKSLHMIHLPVGYDDLKLLSDTLTRVREKQCRIMVFDAGMTVLWSDRTNEDRENHNKIDEWYYLQQTSNGAGGYHYQPLKHDRLHRLFTGTTEVYFCPECRAAFQKAHKCISGCEICGHATDHYSGESGPWQKCTSCHRSFRGKECFERHLETNACQKIWKCRCQKKPFHYPPAVNGVTQSDHVCGSIFCNNCLKFQSPGGHECYIKKIKHESSKNNEKYLFADFETKPNQKHVVNLAFTCDYNGNFWPAFRTVDEWLDYLLTDQWEGYTIIFHNGKGYDFHFIVEAACKRALKLNLTKNGSKLLTFTISKSKGKATKKGYTFIDSLNFLPMALEKFTTTFDLQTVKGFFPLLFNTDENQTYVGPIPDLKFFCVESKSPEKIAELTEWHKNFSGAWNFAEEFEKYCKADVQLLFEGCKKFREITMQVTANALAQPHEENTAVNIDYRLGLDPFQCVTIASSAMKIFRSIFMQEDTFAAVDKETHGMIKEALAGGRTETLKVYWESHDDEMAEYVDFCSLYPWVNKNGLYPVGMPEIKKSLGITDPVAIATMLNRPGLAILNVDVTCPKNLYHPLLHEKRDSKLMFDLRTKKQKSYTNLELQKSVQLGYEITQVHSTIHWEKFTKGPFEGYINCFLQLKQEASGWPSECTTDEQKADYILNYKAHENIQLNPEKISIRNEGLRSVAKLYCNSLWGKFAEMLAEEYTKTKILNADVQGNKVWYDERQHNRIVDFVPLNENAAMVTYKQPKSREDAVLGNRSIAHAVFTTAQARLKLYSILEFLGERVLYCDTDSVIYTVKPGETRLPLGQYLGELCSELGSSYEYGPKKIKEFFSGAPKNYGLTFTIGPPMFKAKGINTRRSDIQAQLAYEDAKQIILGNQPPKVVEFSSIVRYGNFEIGTKTLTKTYRETVTKRNLLPPNIQNMIDTVPWTDDTDPEYKVLLKSLEKKKPPVEDVTQSQPAKKRRRTDESTSFSCYLLQSTRDLTQTYIGSTCDVNVRLMEHNGELKSGGAGAPIQFRPWSLVATLAGFESRSAALSYEWRAQHVQPGHLGYRPFIESKDSLHRAAIKFLYHANPSIHVLTSATIQFNS